MAQSFPLVPLALSVGIAGVDGVLSSSDINSGRVTPTKQRAVWWQAGVLAAGLALELTGKAKPYITEPMLFTPAALFTREMAFKFSQNSQTTPTPAQPYRAQVSGNIAAPRALVATPYMAQQASGLL